MRRAGGENSFSSSLRPTSAATPASLLSATSFSFGKTSYPALRPTGLFRAVSSNIETSGVAPRNFNFFGPFVPAGVPSKFSTRAKFLACALDNKLDGKAESNGVLNFVQPEVSVEQKNKGFGSLMTNGWGEAVERDRSVGRRASYSNKASSSRRSFAIARILETQ